MGIFAPFTNEVYRWCLIAYLLGFLLMMAASEWLWVGWYWLTGIGNVESTLYRIARNRRCPKTVTGLYVWYCLGIRN